MDGFTTALSEQMTAIGTSLTGLVSSALPIVLPIIGGVLVVTKGIGIFKKLMAKAN